MKKRALLLLLLWPMMFAAEPRRLNNLVVEILNLSGNPAQEFQTFKFTQPADGWLFLSAKATVKGNGRLLLGFDDEKNERPGLALAANNSSSDRQIYLAAGEHALRKHADGEALLDQVVLRQIPEMGFSKFGSTPRTLSAGDYDWDFLSKFILPHINTIVGLNSDRQLAEIRQWNSRGGRWLVEMPRPKDPADLAKSFGMTNSYVDGVMLDEFSPRMEGLEAWKTLLKSPEAPKKEIRLYFTDEPNDPMAFGPASKIVWEKYFGEPPPDQDAAAALQKDLGQWMAGLQKKYPEVLKKSVLCLGFFCTPPLSLNRSTEMDFKVWMDRQFQFVATNAAFLGLPALMEYQTRSVDEETFRWAALLFRHYGLEGKTNLLSIERGFNERLRRHIENGDFQNGLAGWTIDPPASARMDRIPKLAFWQGRYPYRDVWDRALVVNASAGPVSVRQELRNLEPGRSYSAKLMAVRREDISTGKSEAVLCPVHLKINEATALPERGSRDLIGCPASSARLPFTGEKPLWLDYQQVVFRANGPTAQLEVQIDKNPLALLVNFVEVQPYLPR